MSVSSILQAYLFYVCIWPMQSKQIPIIGLFTRDDILPGNSTTATPSSLIINYTLTHFQTMPHLKTALMMQRQDDDIPCDMAMGTKFIFDMIHRKPRPLAIFSGSCQTVASAIAEAAGIYDMTIVNMQ
jgi:hypothetical protein